MGAVLKQLGRAFARLRGKRGTGGPETALSHAPTEAATMVAIPWRSSTSWDEYNLRVYPRREPDRFQFYLETGLPITVRVEVPLPGPGLRVRVFSREEGQETLMQASSGERGMAELVAVGRVGGMHCVEIALDPPKSERPQSYRLSIDVPRGSRSEDGARPKRAEFVDVPPGHPYREAIVAVVGAGIMTGHGEWWKFAPDDPVTRVELAEMVRDSLDGEGSGAVPVLLAYLAAQDRLKGALQVLPRDRGRPGVRPQASPPAGPPATRPAGPPAVSTGARRPVAAIARAQAVSLIVRAVERYRPGVLARPPRGFSCTLVSGVHRFHIRIAEHNGLMEGLEGFGPEWDPRLAVSRGEVAEMLRAMMRLERTAAEMPPPVVLPTPVPGPEGEVEPDLAALGMYTSEYLLGAQEEIDRLMAESGPADEPTSRSEARSPNVPLTLDRADLRQKVKQTRDRLRAQIFDSAGSAPATGSAPAGTSGAPPLAGPTQEGPPGSPPA